MRRQSLWQRLSFSDVNPLISALAKRPAEFADLQTVPYVNEASADNAQYPAFAAALPALRTSVFTAIPRFERRALWQMFFIHITDVHLSILGAILSVQILRTFEPGSRIAAGLSNAPSALLLTSASFAVLVFGLNIISTCLHAQKIEREMLLAYRIHAKLATYVFEHVMGMSRQDKIKFQTGDLVNVAQADARNVASFYAHALVDFPVLFISVSVIMGIMLWLIGEAAWIGLLIVVLQIPISGAFSWITTRLNTELMERSDRRISLITEWLQGMRLVRYFGWRKHFESEIGKATRREFRQDLKLKTAYSVGFGMSNSWWMVVSVGIFAALLHYHGIKDASRIFAAIWLTTILGHQLTPLPWFVMGYSEARVGSRRLSGVFRARRQEDEFPVPSSPPAESVEKVFANISDHQFDLGFSLRNASLRFSENEVYALKDVNLEIPANAMTAFVGPVGAGKSVLLQLLMGEIPPTSGQVDLVLDFHSGPLSGQRILIPVHSRWGVAAMRSSQTYVPQEAFIASATVRENVPLRYHDPHEEVPDDTDVLNALYAAQMKSDLTLFPYGLATELGERGVNLSGGQKQRLSLARSAFAASRLIILDDPLSAVDKETEQSLVESLFQERWSVRHTLLWATHRLDWLHHARQIVFLEDGQVVETGGFQELMSKASRLRGFVDAKRADHD